MDRVIDHQISAVSAPVFDGLRVVEFAEGMTGPMTAQLFADNGADVIKVEPPSGDWARSMPGFVMWNRGKSSVVLDRAEAADRQDALRLIEHADVLVDAVQDGVERLLGLAEGALLERFPRLVHARISSFGLAQDWMHLPAYEGIVAARIGRYLGADALTGLAEGNSSASPTYNVTPFGSYASACLAFVGIVGGLRSRASTGRGTHVDTSLMDGMSASTMRMPFRREGDRVLPVDEAKAEDVVLRGITLSFMTAECSDGRFIQMCARQNDHYRRWLQAMELGHLLDDPRFADGPTGFQTIDDIEELDQLIRKAMLQRTQAEWTELFSGEYDCGSDPFLLPAEFLELDDMVLNDRVVEIEDPVVGKTRQLGPLALLGSSTTTIGRPAPALGQHQALLDALAPTERVDVVDLAHVDRGAPPLQGVTIVEAAYFLAGPLASMFLAELGARVIKVEPLAGDPFRRVDTQFAQISHGKESIALDLKHPAGREIMDRLLGKADVFLHSFRPGVPERLGIDYTRLHEMYPKLVYLYGGSYGSRGPQRHRPAFHSTPNALSGAGVVQAGRGNRPVDDSYPDPCGALGAAVAMAMGLHARERTGTGQYIETTMLASTGYVQSDMLVQYEGRPDILVPDQGQHGIHPRYRLYECSAGWLFVAAILHDEWVALAEAVGRADWLTDERFATWESQLEHEDALVAELGEILRSSSAHDWQRRLVERGAPATVADEFGFEEFLVANTPHLPMSHAEYGDYWWRPPLVRLDAVTPTVVAAAPGLGEHTAALLAECGFTPNERVELLEQGVVRGPRA